MKTIAKLFGIFSLITLLSACGGGGGGDNFTGGTGTDGTGGGGGTTSSVKLGYTDNSGTFHEGELNIAVTSLSSGGQTGVIANLVDSAGDAYTTPVAVTFNSTCVGLGTATLTSPVTSGSGAAASVYTDQGCGTTDTITASATVDGKTLTATGTVTVAAQTVGSIQFVSATPTTIALKGMSSSGLTESSTVVFKVLDSVGSPIVGKTVTFALSTSVGGLALSTTSATTIAGGLVQTNVQSGNVHTTVGVIATITVGSTTISTQSVSLTVTTGIADQDSFSLAAVTLNPEAASIDGVTDEFTARLADRFNNPVPDGTAVAFYTSGGSIQGSCTTVNGACSVNWTSQNPRTTDGVAAILAVAIGEESFADNNSNGVFDAGDTFTDMPEAFLDNDQSGGYTAGDFFVDFNIDSTYSAGDGVFNGVLCAHPTLCDTSVPPVESINVRQNHTIIMAESAALITISADPIDISASSQTVTITVVGAIKHQVMPVGTTVAVETSNGSIVGTSSFTVPNTNSTGLGKTQFKVTLKKDTTSDTGTLTVTVTSPSGTQSVKDAVVND